MLLRRLLPRQGLSGHVYCGTLRPSNTSMNFHSKPSNLYDNNGRSNVCDDDTFDAESRKRIEIYKLEVNIWSMAQNIIDRARKIIRLIYRC